MEERFILFFLKLIKLISHSVDPLVRFGRPALLGKVIGKEIYLKMTAECNAIYSHYTAHYVTCMQDTQLGCPRKT